MCCVENASVHDAVVSEAFLRFFVETCGHYTDYICTQQDGLTVFEVTHVDFGFLGLQWCPEQCSRSGGCYRKNHVVLV